MNGAKVDNEDLQFLDGGGVMGARMRALDWSRTALGNPSGLEQVRLVALTGYGQSEDKQRTRDSGFDDHLVKPLDFEALQRILI